jgi:hypothetical protein
MRALIRKENGFEDPAKPQFSNRPLSVESGTLLREKTGAGFKRGCLDRVVDRVIDRVVDSVSAVWVCFEKDLKFLAIELLVAVLIPISEVRFGALPKSPLDEVDFAVAVEIPPLQGQRCRIAGHSVAGNRWGVGS